MKTVQIYSSPFEFWARRLRDFTLVVNSKSKADSDNAVLDLFQHSLLVGDLQENRSAEPEYRIHEDSSTESTPQSPAEVGF